MALLLLFLIVAGSIASLLLIAFGVHAAVRTVRRSAGRHHWLRGSAAFLAAAAALYAWGLLHVAGAVLDADDSGTDTSPLRPCRVQGNPERAMHVIDYTVSYIPLRFLCEEEGGDSYSAPSVPDYINPGALVLALAAAACAGVSAIAPARRTARIGREADRTDRP